MSNSYGYQQLRDILDSALSRGAKNALVRLRIYCDGNTLSFEREYEDGMRQEDLLRMLDIGESAWGQVRKELLAAGAIADKKLRNGRVLYDLIPPAEWLGALDKMPTVENHGQALEDPRKQPTREKACQGFSRVTTRENQGQPPVKTTVSLLYSETSQRKVRGGAADATPHTPFAGASSNEAEGVSAEGDKAEAVRNPPYPPRSQVAPATSVVGPSMDLNNLNPHAASVRKARQYGSLGAIDGSEGVVYDIASGSLQLVNGARAAFEAEANALGISLEEALIHTASKVARGDTPAQIKSKIRREMTFMRERSKRPATGGFKTTPGGYTGRNRNFE